MDAIAEISFFAALILPPIVFFYTLFKLKHLGLKRRFLVGILWSCAAFSSFMIIAWSIFFRDGIGPDSDLQTHGMEALAKCWMQIVFGIVIGIALFVFGKILAKRGQKSSN